MKKCLPLIAVLLTPSAGFAQNTSAFAAADCAGQTYGTDFSNGASGWNVDNNSGDSSLASAQTPAGLSATSNGLNLSVTPNGAMGKPFTGAGANTQGNFYQTYGVFQAIVTLPPANGPGITSAFWLNAENGGWPPEFDVFEFDSSNGSWVEQGAWSNQTGSAQNSYGSTSNLSSGQHVFTLDWEPDTVTFYIDGKQTYQTATPADMHQPMFMRLDAMATNNWNGTPAPGTSATMQVHSVRVFSSMQAALACVPSMSSSTLSSVRTSPTVTNGSTQGASQATQEPSESLPTQGALTDLQNQSIQQSISLEQLQVQVTQQQTSVQPVQEAASQVNYDPCSPDPSLGQEMSDKAKSICAQIQQSQQELQNAEALLQQTLARQGQSQ